MMYYIGYLSLSVYNIVLLRWSPGVSFAVPPSFLRDLCCPVSVLAARRVLRSAARGELLVPQAHLAIMQRRAFSVVGPSLLHGSTTISCTSFRLFPVELHSLVMTSPSKFYISFQSFFFGRDWAGSTSENACAIYCL